MMLNRTPGRGGEQDLQALDARVAVEAAAWAPSVHDARPWVFAVENDRISLRADPERRLDVSDPEGREMLISCGAALFTLRVAIRRLGYEPHVRLLPDRDRPNLLADVHLGVRLPEAAENRRLYGQIRRRRTHR